MLSPFELPGAWSASQGRQAAGGGKITRERTGETPEGKRLLVLSLAALGVVYGDIGTSPLYAIRECFHGEYGIEPSRANILGVLSLMVWSLVLVVCVKYLSFILRADNRGEGGVIALMALVHPARRTRSAARWFLVGLGLFGASLLYGDGMITPAISVMSAVEGLEVATSAFEPYVVVITVVILVGLFLFQHRGTARVGAIFGPVAMLWLAAIALLGLGGILRHPEILASVNPLHGVDFFLRNRWQGYFVLGAVFLVVTGTEALYADMGHFGRRPIRLTWYVFVLPALLMNYFGQGALLLADPSAASHPFYALAPSWALYPLVMLATAATIIASQAVISGAFSLTRQAIQLGYFPRLKIEHTSTETIGQIYIPQLNWLLMLATIGLVLGFRSTSKLAAAYGVAVTATMIIATALFYVVAREKFGWSRLAAGLPAALFLLVDLSFFGANISKIEHGAWFPIAIGVGAYTLMTTWRRGREVLGRRFRAKAVSHEQFLQDIRKRKVTRVPGLAVFMTGNPGLVPPALLHNLEHNKVLHEQVVLLTVVTEEEPRVPPKRQLEVEEQGYGIFSITAHFGFSQDPHVPRVLRRAAEQGLQFDPKSTSYFLGRERVLPRRRGGMARWRLELFSFLSRNAVDATTFFHIPPGRVIEVGAQVEL